MTYRPEEEDPILGEVIDGRYRVTERLGTGGMGFVYLATHVDLGRTMVLKRLRPELVESERTRERFLREARASTRIEHPHTIAVSDFGVHPEYGAYYVMEHLVGQDVAGALAGGALSTERATLIVLQAAEALAAAHAAQIIHRDLKPENIFLIERDGVPDFVKVLDFGLARVMDANRKLTETGQVIGTPRYMAPEQCRGEKVDARADVYSLGLILHQALTGQAPYAGLSTYEILGKKMFEFVTAPSDLEPPVQLPPGVEAFVMRCLEREPGLRPPNGSAMADELHALRTALELPPSPFAHLAEGARNSLPSSSIELSLPPDEPDSAELRQPSTPPSAPRASPSAAPPASLSFAPAPPVPSVVVKQRQSGVLMGVAIALAVLLVGGGLAIGAFLYFGAPEPTPVAATATAIDPRPAQPAASEVAPVVSGPEITVVSEPPGAEVFSGQVRLGETPLTLRIPEQVQEGTAVQVRRPGFVTREVTLFSAVPRAHVQLQPVSPTSPEAP